MTTCQFQTRIVSEPYYYDGWLYFESVCLSSIIILSEVSLVVNHLIDREVLRLGLVLIVYKVSVCFVESY